MLLLLFFRYNSGRILPGHVLYLKDNNARAVIPKAVELKGLLQMRNRLAPSFARLRLDSLPGKLLLWAKHIIRSPNFLKPANIIISETMISCYI